MYRASDGLFVNLELVREGYANAFVKYPFEYKDLFQHHEAQARKARKGIWPLSPSRKTLASNNNHWFISMEYFTSLGFE